MPTMDPKTFYDFNARYKNTLTGEIVKIDHCNYYLDKVITHDTLTHIEREYDSQYFEDHFRKISVYIFKEEDIQLMVGKYVIEKETGNVYKIKSLYKDCSVIMYELECVHDNEIICVSNDIFKRNYYDAGIDIIQSASCSRPQTWDDFCNLALKGGIKPEYGPRGSQSYAQKTWDDFCKLTRKNLRGQDILDDITKIITKGPATIVFWKDGTKTVVKWCESECYGYDLEKGLAMAILKRELGDKYYKRMHKVIMDKWEDHDNK